MKREKKEGRRRTRSKEARPSQEGELFFPKGVSALLFAFHGSSSSARQGRRGFVLNQLCVPAATVFR